MPSEEALKRFALGQGGKMAAKLPKHFRRIGKKVVFCDRFDPDRIYCTATADPPVMLADMQTLYQYLQIFETNEFGAVLALDGYPQIKDGDADYTEALLGTALLLAPRAKRVLFLGAGDGAAPSLALRDPRVQFVAIVDIDSQLVP